MDDARLIDFVGLLRQNAVRVSPGEAADAARALALVPLEEREAVRTALRTALVKRPQDAPVFDRLFELHFGALGRLIEGLEESLAAALSPEAVGEEELAALGRALAATAESAPLGRALLEGGRLGEVLALLRSAALRVDFAGLQSPLQRGFYARRVLAAAGGGGAAAQVRALEESLRAEGLEPGTLERVSQRLGEALRALEEAARRTAELEYRARDRESGPGRSELHRPIASLSREEILRMRSVVRRLAERLKARIVRRRREQRRGQLHVRRTLRRNLHLGGVPATPCFRRKRPDRPDVVVLCDVSDSVRNVSRLMLHFVHTLQSLYARVRTFAFVSDLGEITGALSEVDVDEVLDGAVVARAVNLSANSNYGHALQQFHRDFRGAVTRRTTVLVIGDGRNNYNPPNAWVLEELRRRARRVVWLCPESKSAWGFGDSEMQAYARHCHRVLVVRTVDELSRAAEEILP